MGDLFTQDTKLLELCDKDEPESLVATMKQLSWLLFFSTCGRRVHGGSRGALLRCHPTSF